MIMLIKHYNQQHLHAKYTPQPSQDENLSSEQLQYKEWVEQGQSMSDKDEHDVDPEESLHTASGYSMVTSMNEEYESDNSSSSQTLPPLRC